MKSEIFQGGYVDFIDFDILTRDGLNGAFDGPPRTCMLDDLCFYLEHHSPLLFEMEGATPPLITSVFLKKITASHYVKLIDYFEIIVQRLRKNGNSRDKLTGKPTNPGLKNKNNGPLFKSPVVASRTLYRYPIYHSHPLYPFLLSLPRIHICIPISTSPLPPLHPLIPPHPHLPLHPLRPIRVSTIISSIQGLSSIVANRDALHETRLSCAKPKINSKALTFVCRVGFYFVGAYVCAF